MMKIYLVTIILSIAFWSCKNSDKNVIDGNKRNYEMKQSKSFIIRSKSGIEYEVFNLSEEELNVYMNQQGIIRDHELFKTNGIDAYVLQDGRVAVQELGQYSLYPNKDLLVEILNRSNGPYSRDFFFERNPYGKDFPEVADKLIQSMCDDFQIQIALSDRQKLLASIDSVILKNRNQAFFDKYFLNFIALIGRYNIDEFRGSWKMIQSADKRTWSPILEFNKQNLFFADYLVEEFSDLSRMRPITEVVETVRDIVRINILGNVTK